MLFSSINVDVRLKRCTVVKQCLGACQHLEGTLGCHEMKGVSLRKRQLVKILLRG